jgi:predicted enzyme related to lactoylglutathione lyase
MAGEIVHIELPSSDFARSAAFYGKLFGWKTDGVQSGGHLLFELPGGIQGSWIRDALAQAVGPIPFVAVADVEKVLDEAKKQGGRVLVRKLPLANRGAFGLLADRDGNVIGVLAVKGAGAERPAATAKEPPAGSSGDKGGDKGDGKIGKAASKPAIENAARTAIKNPTKAPSKPLTMTAPRAIPKADASKSGKKTAARKR